MNPVVYHIVAGYSYFTGIALILLMVYLSTRSRRIFHRIAFVSFFVGLLAVVLSSTPIPYWYYSALTATTMYWVITLRREASRNRANAAMAIAWLGAAAMELPWLVVPELKPATASRLTIVGDSVSAGMEEREAETWPSLLARQHEIKVQDLSHVGETAGSALKRTIQHNIDSPIILLEIGGNDIFGSTTSTEFETDLDALLSHLRKPGRQLVMFELPLPPFYHEFGRIQRMLSKRHGVQLIPKQIFLSIIAEGDSTLDSIHLSQKGHQRMAELVWKLIQPAVD